MRKILLPILVVLCVVFYGCKNNVICPAFQSTYILDDSIRMAKYSLFSNDSTPKMAMASRRTKYGVNKKTSLFKKNYDLMTAPKVNVFGVPALDSLYAQDEGDFLVSDFEKTDSLGLASIGLDSLGLDSTTVAPEFAVAEDEGPKFKYRYNVKNKYNIEQEYYNKYYGELFVDNRPPPPTAEELAAELAAQEGDSTVTEGKKKGFGLFKKRPKSDEVEEELEEGELEGGGELDQTEELIDEDEGFEVPESAPESAPADEEEEEEEVVEEEDTAEEEVPEE